MEKRHLEKLIRLPLDELKLAFAASCVEGIARKTGKHYSEVYERMSKVGLLRTIYSRTTTHYTPRATSMCWRTLRSIYRIEKGVKTLTDKYLHFYDSERI